MDPAVLRSIEKSLIRGKWDVPSQTLDLPAVDLAQSVTECRFGDALKSPSARVVFQLRAGVLDGPLSEVLGMAKPTGDDPVQQELIRLSLAIACLHAFVQANWTGPDLDFQPLDLLQHPDGTTPSLTQEILNQKAISELAYGGEPAYHLASFPAFLRFAQLLLADPFTHLTSAAWWRLRVATIHQNVLDGPVPPPEDFAASVEPLVSTIADEPDLAGRMYLDLGLLDHHLSQDKRAAEYFVKAARSTGLEYELTGALGKRTKFQVAELSQLVLLAESHLPLPPANDSKSETEDNDNKANQDTKTPNAAATAPPVPVTATDGNVPQTLALNDDTLLEETAFTSSRPAGAGSRLSHIDPSNQPPLHPLDQSILLSLCLNVRNTSPSHGLTGEQMMPFVSRVISHPRNWSVHTMALLLRSRLESSRTRTVERSTLQLAALIDQMPTSDSTVSERLAFFHSIPLPSKWEMEKELAERYLSIGVVKSALEIFERLETWEEVVKCYAALEKREQGIAVVKELLEGKKKEADEVLARRGQELKNRAWGGDKAREAKLWCLLGELEPDHAEEHYRHAWEVSNGTSGRAMRSLGGYYFARGNYKETIVCLGRAVKINPLLSRSWFILGCACIREEDWEQGKEAFGRCVAIDEEDGESWNNLASMYLRMGIIKKQQRADSEGLDAEDGSGSSQVVDPAKADKIPFENKLLAFRALKQGLRYRYESWRMWYNYMVVAMDVGELQESCRAMGHIVEQTSEKLGAQAVDEDVLERLVDAATRSGDEGQGEGSASTTGAGRTGRAGEGLPRMVSSLFERTILPRVSTPRIFRAYARFLSWQGNWEGSIKAYLDWYRSSSAGRAEGGEITDVAQWREAVTEVEDIVDILRNFGPRMEGQKNKWRLQGRSIVRTFIGRTRDFEDEPEWHRLIELQDELRKDEGGD